MTSQEYYDTGESRYLTPEMRAAYPQAQRAIILCSELTADDWEKTRKTAEAVGFAVILSMFKDNVRGACESPQREAEILAEMDTPDFTRYLQAKLGML